MLYHNIFVDFFFYVPLNDTVFDHIIRHCVLFLKRALKYINKLHAESDKLNKTMKRDLVKMIMLLYYMLDQVYYVIINCAFVLKCNILFFRVRPV